MFYSTILSKELNFIHFDSDLLIEKKINKSISKIFLEQGEKHFRSVEEDLIISMLNKKKCVISLGGGSILSKKIRKSLKNNSLTIFLNVDIKILYERLKSSKKRPLLKNENIINKLDQLYEDRKKYYTKANLIIKNYNSANETIKKILEKLIKYEKNYNKN